MAAGSGLRESELFGLRFEDIDFQKGGANVARQLQNGTVLAPKTEKSRRFVPLPPAIFKTLGDHPRRSVGGLVFLSPEGNPMNASNLHRRIWHPLLERAGIEPPMPRYFAGTRSEPDLEAGRAALDEAFRNGKLSGSERTDGAVTPGTCQSANHPDHLRRPVGSATRPGDGNRHCRRAIW